MSLTGSNLSKNETSKGTLEGAAGAQKPVFSMALVSAALLMSINAGLWLFLAEGIYYAVNARLSLQSFAYIFAPVFVGTLLLGVMCAAFAMATELLDRRLPVKVPLPYLSAVFSSAPQVFVTAHMMKSFEMNTAISLAVLLLSIAAIAVAIDKLRLSDWSFLFISAVCAFLCISTLHSDYALARVSQDKIDIYFIYIHAMPFVSLALTATLYLAVRHCLLWTSIPILPILSLVAGIAFMYIALPALSIGSPDIEGFLGTAFVCGVLYGATRVQVIRKTIIALPIWIGSLLVATYLAIAGATDIGLVWSLSNATVLPSMAFDKIGLFDESFGNTASLFRAQPEYRLGKRAIVSANEWNSKNANTRKSSLSVILITIDALRYDVLGKYHPREESYTPNLDRFLTKSTYFKNTYAQGGWTSISLPSLIWSKYPRLLKFVPLYEDNKLELHTEPKAPPGRKNKRRFQAPMKEPSPNIAKVLAKSGYRTYAITNDASTSYFNPKLGFSKWFKHSLYPKEVRKRYTDKSKRGMNLDEVAADTVIETISNPDATPFFIWTHIFAPHGTYKPPSGYGIPFQGYKGEVFFADMLLGRILKALEETKKDKDTIVIVTGDHGESFKEHNTSYHGTSLYDHAMKVPLLFHMPGQTGGAEIETAVGLIDIAPTILDTLGIRIPNTMHGITLRPAIEKKLKTFDRAPVFLETWKDNLDGTKKLSLIAAVHGDHKLIVDLIKKSFSFFDLKKDPKEQRNLLEERDMESGERFSKLGGYLEGWRNIKRP